MKRTLAMIILAAAAVAMVGCGQTIAVTGTCTVTEQHTITESTSGANGVNIKGQAGTVKVIGRPGLQDVKVTATACAVSEAALKQFKVTTERSSDGWVRVLTEVPRGQNKFDITVETPEELQLMVRNDNGIVDVSHVLRGANVRGDNGAITVSDVKGGLTVESRNGTVGISQVEGNVGVTRADNGALVITDIKGNVTLTKKTGIVTVVNVNGDLTVTGKVNGLVTQKGVTGRVSIPK